MNKRRKGAQDYWKENCPDIGVIGVWEAKDSYSIAKHMMTSHKVLKAIYCTAGGLKN